MPLKLEHERLSGDILIIDDNFEDVRILDRLLREAGYQVRAVRDGAAGIRAAQLVQPDLILLDLLLPDEDGLTVGKHILADENLRNIPLIFVSAVHDVTLKAQAFEIGAHDYITKPFNGQEVLIRIEHHLQRNLLRAKLQENALFRERQRIARELHDSVNQTLFILSISVQSLLNEQEIAVLPEAARQQLMQLHTLSKSAQAEMRTLLNELRPANMRDLPIPKLLGHLVDAFRLRIGAEITFVVAEVDLPKDVKLTLYRITQEALTNIAKHANASRVSVILREEDNAIRLIIRDNGCGFDPGNAQAGVGLASMQERALQMRMSYEIASAPEEGTSIQVIWNCE